MRISLVFPESTFLSSSNVWPPLGLWYLAAQLEAQGHQTEFFDMGLGDKLPNDGEYDQMWISGTSPQMHSIRKIGEHTKNFKHTKTVFGGAAAWANPQSALELPFDLIVSGEADHPETVAQILHRVNEPYKLYSPPMHKDLDWVLPPIRRWNLRYHSYMTDSTGKSYRMASIFTARGCPMSCAFCIAENQKVLMADLTYKNIQDIKIGDIVMGITQSPNNQRIISPTLVTNVIDNGVRNTIKITAGTQAIECTPDHKILVDDSWDTRWKRADSTVAGRTRVRLFPTILERSSEFRRGWLAGYIAGDGCVHKRKGKTQITITSRDPEMLDIIQEWGLEFGCNFRRFNHKMGGSIFPTKLNKDYIDAVQCTGGVESDAFLYKVAEMKDLSFEYMEGWLGGMYDSDGTLDSGGDCRIIQSNRVKPHNTKKIEQYLDYLGINYCMTTRDEGINYYCMNRSVFFALCRPMMNRKYPKSYTYRGLPKHDVDSVLDNGEKRVYDLTTEAHSFICNGFVVHNCESGRHGVIWGNMTRYEPLDKVETQIRDIVGMGFTGLAYYDDIFILNKQRTEKLLDLHVKYNLAFRCFLRSDILQKHGGRDYLKKMADAGLIEIFIGVESASNQIKNNIHKGTTIEQDTNVVNWCHELGVLPKCSLILGLPGETRETMETTRQWILQQDPSRIRIQVDRLIPFKGTPLTDHPEEYDLKYEQQPDEEWFFKGRMDLDTHSFVSTSSLSVQEIDDFWRSLENEMREKGYRS